MRSIVISALALLSGVLSVPFATTNVVVASASRPPAASLAITSSLPKLPNGLSPVAGAPVAIIRNSLDSKLRATGKFTGQSSPVRAWMSACIRKQQDLCRALSSSQELEPVAQGQLDGNGGTTFTGLTEGTYYVSIYGLGSSGSGQVFIWDMRVDLKTGANSVVLEQRNAALYEPVANLLQTPPATDKVTKAPPPTAAAANPVSRPSGPKNSTVSIRATDNPGQPVAGTYFYLLDDDVENILRSVGFEKQMLLGQEMPLLNSYQFVATMVAMQQNPAYRIIGEFAGGDIIPPEVKQQYDLGTKALADHTVATAVTNAAGQASFGAVPAGTYYIYGTTNQFVKVGELVSVDRRTITPTETKIRDTGYNSYTIWNLKVAVKAGPNSVSLTRANAAFVTK